MRLASILDPVGLAAASDAGQIPDDPIVVTEASTNTTRSTSGPGNTSAWRRLARSLALLYPPAPAVRRSYVVATIGLTAGLGPVVLIVCAVLG